MKNYNLYRLHVSDFAEKGPRLGLNCASKHVIKITWPTWRMLPSLNNLLAKITHNGSETSSVLVGHPDGQPQAIISL